MAEVILWECEQQKEEICKFISNNKQFQLNTFGTEI